MMKNPDRSADTLQILARVDRREIAYLNAILESYEGLGVLRTLDPEAGIICFYVTRSLSETAYRLLLSLQEETHFEFLTSLPKEPHPASGRDLAMR